MKKLLIILLLTFFSTQASAWVSKGFVPANVSLITVNIDDQANDGCWTNIGEVKRYAEDKLELAGLKVSRDRFENYEDNKHFILNVLVTVNRLNGTCYGDINLNLFKGTWVNNIGGLFYAGKYGANFTGYENVNQYTLELIGVFMKQVEDPQW
jgi:hypothetical protein